MHGRAVKARPCIAKIVELMERKLTANPFADVHGYSRLIAC
jgi:hypothetical protein